jgi:cytochrome d ubiquinol oxidase subunit I
MGYALLLKTAGVDPMKATDADIAAAAERTVPKVATLFWSFRIMVGLGLLFILMFAFAFWVSATQRFERYHWFLRFAFYALPLPWISTELGWVVAETGRQPWVIEGVLPTALGASSISGLQVLGSLTGFVLFYSILAVVDLFLTRRYILMGPDEVLAKTIVAPEERRAMRAREA